MTRTPVALVLLPGLDGTGTLFSPLLDHLPEWIHPVVVSYPVDKACGYSGLMEIVANALPVNVDYVLLGESFSGPLAILTAAGKPPGLKGIILCATFVKKPFRFVPTWLSHLSVAPIFRLWPATIELRAIFTGNEFKSLADRALAAIKSVDANVIATRVKAIFNVDVQQQLLQTRLPILYLAGRKDRLIRAHNLAGIKQLRPDMTVAELDTQHFVLQLAPANAAHAIEKFIVKHIPSIQQPTDTR